MFVFVRLVFLCLPLFSFLVPDFIFLFLGVPVFCFISFFVIFLSLFFFLVLHLLFPIVSAASLLT